MTTEPHSHCWIDLADPPIARASYSPVIGPGRREMQPGRTYHCRECCAVCVVPSTVAEKA